MRGKYRPHSSTFFSFLENAVQLKARASAFKCYRCYQVVAGDVACVAAARASQYTLCGCRVLKHALYYVLTYNCD